MLKIRLQRVGRKHDASFRMIVTDSRRGPKAGNVIEVVGVYDPKKDITSIKGDRVKHWMSVGAQVSNTTHNLLVSEKIIEGAKKNVLPKKSPIKKEGEEEEAAPAAETPAKEEALKEEAPSEEKKPEAKPEEKKEEAEDKKEEKETKE